MVAVAGNTVLFVQGDSEEMVVLALVGYVTAAYGLTSVDLICSPIKTTTIFVISLHIFGQRNLFKWTPHIIQH